MANAIVVVGAGVSGLTSALLLSKSKANRVTVVAKHMPGDYAAEYASPWAGANFLPMNASDDSRWERRTWPELKRLTEEVPEAGIHFQASRIFRRDQDQLQPTRLKDPLFDRDPWYQTLFADYRELGPDELLPGHDSGCEFTSVCINTATYLQWLLGQCLKHGVVVRRAVLSDIAQAPALSHTDAAAAAVIVVNATGLGSLTLGGVADSTVTPARGQTVLVRNECSPMLTTSGTDDERPDELYIMQRAGGGGTVLGGTYDIGSWDSSPDPNTAVRIMKRVVEACPDIAGGRGIAGLSIIRHGVGLRPYRPDGARIEAEQRRDGTWVIHNYGHAGWGYQASYGCAERVVELVNQIRRERGESLDDEPPLFSWD